MRKLLDLQHPFFTPLWRRVATVGAIFAWAIFEWSIDNPYWSIGFAALGGYCAWEFFFDYQPRDREDDLDK